ncbi:MAG TPA: bifunctional phosphopantothenoylcysteine decarboxylase/phosphopantothenate--cysteine ligase CoaBC [Cytophagaceae bacterium]
MLHGKKILLGVSGSIAAYKAAFLVRLLVKEGAEVKVVMTASASQFISPLTLSTLSLNPVYSDTINGETGEWNNHVELALWADYFLVAPATANTIGKFANGICDNLISAVYFSAKSPVIIAPAMDLDMYLHPAIKENMARLVAFGNKVMNSPHGALASGLIGEGRMPEPEDILKYLSAEITQSQRFRGKKVMITAGPTYEALDPVRYLGNRSTGKMGYEIAAAFALNGAKVTLISGPSKLTAPSSLEKFISVTSAEEMYNASLGYFKDADIVILSAAVADYRPKNISAEKIKKKEDQFQLELIKNIDIAASLGQVKSHQFMVGFALETENEIENAKNKRRNKNLDLIVLNSLKDDGAGFEKDTNKVSVIDQNNKIIDIPLKSKKELAFNLVDIIRNKMSEQIDQLNKSQ